jgi:hypothetical protein
VPEPQRACFPTLGLDPDDDEKALSEKHMIADGLLDFKQIADDRNTILWKNYAIFLDEMG